MNSKNLYSMALSVLLISACGSGGSESPSKDTNIAPKVAITGGTQVDAGATIKIMADATDSDGSVVSYLWELEPGSVAVLGDTNKANVSLTASDVDKDTSINLAVTVTDNAGAVTKSNVALKIVAKKTSVTLTGLVTDGAVINASLAVAVGDLEFTTQTDANGNYTIKLDVDRAHINKQVLITAVSQNKLAVKLVSQLPSVSTLLLQAGVDQQLKVDENFGVNVTPLSTAKYALMLQRWQYYYGVGPIAVDNDELLQALSESFAHSPLFKLAALIKIAAHTNISLPPNTTYSLDFALNSSLARTFELAVDVQDADLIYKTIGLIEQDTNINNQKKATYTGDYIFYSPDPLLSYWISFSSATRGTAKSVVGVSEFNWSGTDHWLEVTMDKPLPMPLRYENINRVTFSTYDEIWGIKKGISNIYYNSRYAVDGTLVDYDIADGVQGSLLPVSSAFVPEKNELTGNWILGSARNAQNLQLNADGSASLRAPDNSVVLSDLTWALTSHSVQISQASTPIIDIYLLSHVVGGYQYVSTDWRAPTTDASSIFADEGRLIRAQNIVLTKSDLVGTYATNYGPAMITSDGRYSEGFSAIGTSLSDQNNWNFFSYQQNGAGWLPDCDLATNKACKLFKWWNYRIVAANDDGFYVLKTEKNYDPDGTISYTSFSLSSMSKLPKILSFGDWITQDSALRFYQQTSEGVKVWFLNGSALSINDKAYDFASTEQKLSTYTLAQGKLHYERDGSARVLELISVSENGLNVCEYNEGASCNAGTKFLLSNRNPAGISFSVEGQGSIEHILSTTPPYGSYGSNAILYDPNRIYGNATAFAIKADPGYEVVSVSGCGGTLSGAIYKTAIIKDKCTISAVFKKTGS